MPPPLYRRIDLGEILMVVEKKVDAVLTERRGKPEPRLWMRRGSTARVARGTVWESGVRVGAAAVSTGRRRSGAGRSRLGLGIRR